jgi:hypothetical protein
MPKPTRSLRLWILVPVSVLAPKQRTPVQVQVQVLVLLQRWAQRRGSAGWMARLLRPAALPAPALPAARHGY